MNWNTIAQCYRRLIDKQSNGMLTDTEQAFINEVTKACYGVCAASPRGSVYPSTPTPFLVKKLYRMMPYA